LAICTFIAKALHVTVWSSLLHFFFLVGSFAAYVGTAWIHLALEKLWYGDRSIRILKEAVKAAEQEE
jgi:hypothetical protein